jgi:hypothetical protein
MMMMQMVITLQKELLVALGPDNPFVKPDNLYNALSKQVEAAGLKTPSLYFTQPDPQEVAARLEAQKNAPSPEEQKAQAQMQLEQFKAGVEMQVADKKMQADASKEQAQLEADLITKDKDRETQVQLKMMDIQWEREKFAMEQAAAEKERQADREFQAEQSDKQRTGDIQKTQAQSIGKALEKNEASKPDDMGSKIEELWKLIKAPKRLVRDEKTGRAVGVETVE